MTYKPYMLPVSVKGVVFDDKAVWLRRNERSEWELPGGKLDPGEQPAQTVERELQEELGMSTRASEILQAHVLTIPGSIDESQGVLVLSYLCELLEKTGSFEYEGESGAAQFRRFSVDEVIGLTMPDFYKSTVAKAWSLYLAL